MGAEATVLEIAASNPESRIDLWRSFIDATRIERMAEVGVFRGKFAAAILGGCDGVASYHMIDPWRNLEDWRKPANVSDERFAELYEEAMEKTAPWEDRRTVLRGRTTEVIDRIPDDSLDLVYIDGDHTLRGIAIDLIACYPKVRAGGWIAGDDFSATIWQHAPPFEPTLVFPFAVHFAEAVDERIYALPHEQFLIEKRAGQGFEFRDLTGRYADLTLIGQLGLDGEDVSS